MMQTTRKAPAPQKLNEFQEGILEAKRKLQKRGLQEGRP
jgi:hypothetical protein